MKRRGIWLLLGALLPMWLFSGLFMPFGLTSA